MQDELVRAHSAQHSILHLAEVARKRRRIQTTTRMQSQCSRVLHLVGMESPHLDRSPFAQLCLSFVYKLAPSPMSTLNRGSADDEGSTKTICKHAAVRRMNKLVGWRGCSTYLLWYLCRPCTYLLGNPMC